ncbi:MAG: hypothetical protein D6736_08500, partial [Nitrospinota bacterium]
MRNFTRRSREQASDALTNPLRRMPKLGKFIILALLIHVIAISLFYLLPWQQQKKQKPVKVKPPKVELLYPPRPAGSRTSSLQGRPFSPLKPILSPPSPLPLRPHARTESPETPPLPHLQPQMLSTLQRTSAKRTSKEKEPRKQAGMRIVSLTRPHTAPPPASPQPPLPLRPAQFPAPALARSPA